MQPKHRGTDGQHNIHSQAAQQACSCRTCSIRSPGRTSQGVRVSTSLLDARGGQQRMSEALCLERRSFVEFRVDPGWLRVRPAPPVRPGLQSRPRPPASRGAGRPAPRCHDSIPRKHVDVPHASQPAPGRRSVDGKSQVRERDQSLQRPQLWPLRRGPRRAVAAAIVGATAIGMSPALAHSISEAYRSNGCSLVETRAKMP